MDCGFCGEFMGYNLPRSVIDYACSSCAYDFQRHAVFTTGEAGGEAFFGNEERLGERLEELRIPNSRDREFTRTALNIFRRRKTLAGV